MALIQLNVNINSKDIPSELGVRIFELSTNGIELSPKSYDFPMPWDAACWIEDDMFIIDGDLGQQASHNASATVKIPLDRVSQYLDISIHPADEEDEEELINIFTEYGWLDN